MDRSPSTRTSTTSLLVTMAVCVALAVGGVYAWQRFARAADSRDSVRAPLVTRPEMRDLETTVNATGTIRLRTGAEVRVGAQISGMVTQLNVTVGSHVKKDDVIALIDSRGLEARIEQARAQIAVDQAARQKLESQLNRTEQLRGLVPRQQEEDLKDDVKSAQAKLDKSKADLLVVESDIPYLTIRAPITGTVASISTQQGETVASSFNAPTFATIIEDNALELVAMVDETDIAGVQPSNNVTFTTETYPSREFHGQVARIAPKATIVSGVVNYEVGIKLTNAVTMLKPDMTANVTIETAHRRALTIPYGAVQKGDERFVYIVRNGMTEKRMIVAGQRSGGWIEVKNGLAVEESILMGEPRSEKK
jgi:macrolide-specific efflux system membrane fusion protein